MSIIEKAVGKLGKSENAGRAQERPVSSSVATAATAVPEARVKPASVVRRQAASARSRAPSGDLPVIQIPFDSLHEQGMLVPTVPRSVVAEAFRSVKRPLLKNVAGQSAVPIKGANLIMVTSALQGEGKTFTSISLALSLAMEQDKRVLFVDADVAKASAGSLLGVPRDRQGLIDVLEHKGVGLADVMLRTNMDKLSILPAGSYHERCNELLASDSMRDIMMELSQRYSDRVVVFDSPPVLLTTEAGVLANLMGQIVFVVQADSTPQHVITEALERIREDKMVGMVLNQARSGRLNSLGYGYGYGYGYGSGYGQGHRDSEAAQDPAAGA